MNKFSRMAAMKLKAEATLKEKSYCFFAAFTLARLEILEERFKILNNKQCHCRKESYSYR